MKLFRLTFILSFTPSPWLKKILEFVSVERLRSTSILPFPSSPWLKKISEFEVIFCISLKETPQIDIDFIFYSFAMVEENFGIERSQTPILTLSLSFTTSP